MGIEMKFCIPMLLALLGADVNAGYKEEAFHCRAYCRFLNKKEGWERKEVKGSGQDRKHAWKFLNLACSIEKAGELQVKNPGFTSCAGHEPLKVCEEPEFFAATMENACL